MFEARIHKSRAPHVKLHEYHAELGKDQDKLALHRSLVVILVKDIISRGGKRGAHVKWDELQTKAELVLKHTMRIKKTTPGWEHWEWNDYEDEFGPLATNGNLGRGHREWWMDGIRGVLVPDKRVTKIKLSNEMAVEMNQQVASCIACTGISIRKREPLHVPAHY